MNGGEMEKGKREKMLALKQTRVSMIMTHLCARSLHVCKSAEGDPHAED